MLMLRRADRKQWAKANDNKQQLTEINVIRDWGTSGN